eukprot:1186015-Prorocentrum_minimum.AAC.1
MPATATSPWRRTFATKYWPCRGGPSPAASGRRPPRETGSRCARKPDVWAVCLCCGGQVGGAELSGDPRVSGAPREFRLLQRAPHGAPCGPEAAVKVPNSEAAVKVPDNEAVVKVPNSEAAVIAPNSEVGGRKYSAHWSDRRTDAHPV